MQCITKSREINIFPFFPPVKSVNSYMTERMLSVALALIIAVPENVCDFLYCMCNAEKGTPLTELDLRAGAENYLAKGGLTQDEISRIYDFVTA